MTISSGDIIALMSSGVLRTVETTTLEPLGEITIIDKKVLPKVVNILQKYGKQIDYYVYDAYDFDETTGTGTPGAETVTRKYSIPPYEVEMKYVDRDLVQVGDMLTGVAGLGLEFTPENGIEVRFDSQIWRVVRYQPIYSGQKIALFLFQLRK